jgi:hypothetical protein
MVARIALALLTSVLVSVQLEAQTLSVRPSPFSDLRPGRKAKQGEVVMGQTTLKGALRIFAVELKSEMVSVPRAHAANPDTVPTGTVWQVGSHEVRPYHRLDLGDDRYVLNFDRNERLVSAITEQLPSITQPMLSEHYPGIQRGHRSRSGDQAIQEWVANVDTCVVLSALVKESTGLVEQMSYNYTCETKPAGKK